MTRDNGFTLLEVLVSLVILGFISAILAAMLGFGLGPLARTVSRTEAVAESSPGISFLLSLLADARPTNATGGGFSGTPGEVTLLAPVAAGLSVVRIGVVGETLWARWLRPDAADGKQDVLVQPVRSVQFRYRGGDGVWRRSWQGMARLPTAVSVTVTGPDGNVLAERLVVLRITGAADDLAALRTRLGE